MSKKQEHETYKKLFKELHGFYPTSKDCSYSHMTKVDIQICTALIRQQLLQGKKYKENE